jgi:hypothetical protein
MKGQGGRVKNEGGGMKKEAAGRALMRQRVILPPPDRVRGLALISFRLCLRT